MRLSEITKIIESVTPLYVCDPLDSLTIYSLIGAIHAGMTQYGMYNLIAIDTTPDRLNTNEVHGAIIMLEYDDESESYDTDVYLFMILPGTAPLSHEVTVNYGSHADFDRIRAAFTLNNY